MAAEAPDLLCRAQEVDDEKDRRCGTVQRGDESPAELAFREERFEKKREAIAVLEAKAQAAADQAEEEGCKEHSGVPGTRPSATSPMLNPAS